MHSGINAGLEYLDSAKRAKGHIEFLAGSIGARPSCREGERQAAAYAAGQMEKYGSKQVQLESFRGSPSSYARYALAMLLPAISAALLGLSPTTFSATALIIASILGAAAILQESDFRWNWAHLLIPSLPSVNVITTLDAAAQRVRDVVLVAHLDTHRTPWFNASRTGQRLFRHAFRLALLLLAICFFSGIVTLWNAAAIIRWLALISGILLFMLGLVFLQADFTPFSPGAYDNASGVGSLLGIAERLVRSPLLNCRLWFVFTGCEETGCGGMRAFLDRNINSLKNPLVINLDQMGSEVLYIRTCEGFIVRRCVDEQWLGLAARAAAEAGMELIERPSQAFSDAAVASQRGIPAISLGTQPSSPEQMTHRHRTSDLPTHINSNGLVATQKYLWALLQMIDRQSMEGVSDD